MAVELQPGDFEIARSLFADLGTFQVSAAAVIDGESDGRLLVDDPDLPRSGVMTSPEGAFLAGNPANAGFNAALHRFVHDDLFGRLGWRALYVTLDSPSWDARLAALAAPEEPLTVRRRHYECREPRLDWRARVPDGCTVRRIDENLLDDESVTVPDHVRGWIVNNWGTRERFLEWGFGFTAMSDTGIVSWSLADCRSGAACEIGIQTLADFRRRGLATITAAATVEHALSSGFKSVGWHCNEDNLGSIGTAERVGFDLERRYCSQYFRAPHDRDA